MTADAGTVDLNDVVSSTTGSITITGDAVTQDANIATGGAGTIQVTADIGAITMASGTSTTSANGAITYSATTDVSLGQLSSTSGPLSVTADSNSSGSGAILDNTNTDVAANLITTGTATLSAAQGIGASGTADIDTTIGTLVATNRTSGNIFIQETNGLVIAGTGVRTLLGNGQVNIDVDAGSLTVNSVVTAHGSGAVTLNADLGTVDLNALVSSTTGVITITGDAVTQDANIATGGAGTIDVTADKVSITMASGTSTTSVDGAITYSATTDVTAGKLTSTGGKLSVTADAGTVDLNDLVSSTTGVITITGDAVTQDANIATGGAATIDVTADNGSITMADLTTTTTDTGSISYSATGSVALSLLTSTSGALNVTAGSGLSIVGAITDATADEAANLVTTGKATLKAETGIGSGGGDSDIDTAVAKLDITNSIGGDIDLTEADAVTLVRLSQSGGGDATLRTTNGTITVDNAGAVPSAITFTSAGTLLLDANGVAADVIVNDGIQAVQGHITLLADRDIVASSTPIASSGGNGSIVLQATRDIVATLAPISTSGGNGNIVLQAGHDIVATSAPIAASGGNGNVVIQAGHDIRILDVGNLNPVDVSVAGLGAIRLSAATGVIVLGSQDVTQHTVANDVVLQTGTGAVTNTLPLVYDIQAPQINSQGQVFLTMTIGRPGETNITVTVFWGDGKRTTMSFPMHGTYTFSHQYFGNPNLMNQAAPILINVQVAHDPHVVLTAQNVNTPVGSVPDIGVPAPPPVPAQNINADLSRAVYVSDARAAAAGPFSGPDTKLFAAPGNLASPGVVVFQDTTLRATVVPVPGDGLASFPFDVAPPVELLTLPEAAKIYDTLQQAGVQISEGSTVRISAVQSDETQLSERTITLEVISPDGTVQQSVVLPESVLDDLHDVISKLPDGTYRFQLREPGEARLRLLLEVEVRQGKIVGKDEATDRPPSTKKKPGVMSDPPALPESTPDATNDATDPEGSIMQVLPAPGMHQDSIVRESQEQWGGWSSGMARRAWRRAESVGTFRMDRDDSSDEVSLTAPDAPAQLSRAAQLFRKFSKSVEG